jgi:hypothetical protein
VRLGAAVGVQLSASALPQLVVLYKLATMLETKMSPTQKLLLRSVTCFIINQVSFSAIKKKSFIRKSDFSLAFDFCVCQNSICFKCFRSAPRTSPCRSVTPWLPQANNSNSHLCPC